MAPRGRVRHSQAMIKNIYEGLASAPAGKEAKMYNKGKNAGKFYLTSTVKLKYPRSMESILKAKERQHAYYVKKAEARALAKGKVYNYTSREAKRSERELKKKLLQEERKRKRAFKKEIRIVKKQLRKIK